MYKQLYVYLANFNYCVNIVRRRFHVMVNEISNGTQRDHLVKLVMNTRWPATFSALGLYTPAGPVTKCQEIICTST